MTPENARFWKEKYAQTTSDEDARMVSENLISFFELLMEWKAKEVPATHH